uniref:Glucosyl transferase n=1 Tax=Desertifilum tharense IPPAS B-1220 TaxID=1781255 RepID=A0ACD5GUZ3_9CYAN
MILATVGTEPYPFNRLMTWIGALIERGFLDEEMVVQYGSCTHLPPGVKCYQHLKTDLFDRLSAQARITISQCDENAIAQLDRAGNPYILVPRAQCYKEHIDDRQIELALSLDQAGVPIAWSPGDLVRFLASPQRLSLPTIKAAANDTLSQRLNNLAG